MQTRKCHLTTQPFAWSCFSSKSSTTIWVIHVPSTQSILKHRLASVRWSYSHNFSAQVKNLLPESSSYVLYLSWKATSLGRIPKKSSKARGVWAAPALGRKSFPSHGHEERKLQPKSTWNRNLQLQHENTSSTHYLGQKTTRKRIVGRFQYICRGYSAMMRYRLLFHCPGQFYGWRTSTSGDFRT